MNASQRKALIGLACITPVIAAGLALQSWLRRPTVEKARAFYASQSEFLRPEPYSPTPLGLVDSRASTCGLCHKEIYAEWKVSTHARAWLDDAQFQEELAKTRLEPGRDAGWICVNCHTPMEAQLEKLVAGLVDGDRGLPIYVDNPHFDPELQLEAITCGTCHIRDGVILGPYGDTVAPHPVRKAPELLESQQCLNCHQATHAFPEVQLACLFDTGGEFNAGPYAKQGYTCQRCHMPEVERPLTDQGTPRRKTRRHWFGGSLIPKKPEFEAELAPLRDVYPDGLALRWKDLPTSVAPGAKVTLTLELENAEAGHLLPTGDPERFLLVNARVLDATGAVLSELKERIGTVYDWDMPVTKLSDNRLKPKEKREHTLTFTAPATGPLTLELDASKWRLSEENMRYHNLEGRTVAGRPFHTSSRTLPVR